MQWSQPDLITVSSIIKFKPTSRTPSPNRQASSYRHPSHPQRRDNVQTCAHCGRRGHRVDECWSIVGYPASSNGNRAGLGYRRNNNNFLTDYQQQNRLMNSNLREQDLDEDQQLYHSYSQEHTIDNHNYSRRRLTTPRHDNRSASVCQIIIGVIFYRKSVNACSYFPKLPLYSWISGLIKMPDYVIINARGTKIQIPTNIALQVPPIKCWFEKWIKNNNDDNSEFYMNRNSVEVHLLFDQISRNHLLPIANEFCVQIENKIVRLIGIRKYKKEQNARWIMKNVCPFYGLILIEINEKLLKWCYDVQKFFKEHVVIIDDKERISIEQKDIIFSHDKQMEKEHWAIIYNELSSIGKKYSYIYKLSVTIPEFECVLNEMKILANDVVVPFQWSCEDEGFDHQESDTEQSE
ncbi:unnamed protein product [Didymodactylos carnosus]|uniref:CCHC-type domain-containing protein n=1 Tax=Didymodactylos carnosus TaxID=1234261 RepID=A0A815BYD1_9BILA|nr:unnamed protein product [Didymodactylos carnosus]CAF1276294.1 unnamed protein product [Didymodactylos carnosus]CAF3847215.1 unnamed protein product [Didymodactylos carnosus]CAF4068163.1 unnamed protein product [Didymodactylos carnosus]